MSTSWERCAWSAELSLRVFTAFVSLPSSLTGRWIIRTACASHTSAPHCPWARAKFFLSYLEEKPDCSKARCEVQFSPRCPEDSVLIEGYAPPGECCPLPSRCVCDPAGCLRKVCQPGYLNILVSKASGKPGECCDLYECKPGTRKRRLRSIRGSGASAASPGLSLPVKMAILLRTVRACCFGLMAAWLLAF